ncbi:hypothetical protein [Elizabethkingia anophelis]|nr:hypothetical protein [Elizabethkingia anophelis]
MEHYRRKYSKERRAMKLTHIAGKKLHIIDKNTGELLPVEVL